MKGVEYCYSVGDEVEGWVSEEHCFFNTGGVTFQDGKIIIGVIGDLGIRRESHKTVKQITLFADKLEESRARESATAIARAKREREREIFPSEEEERVPASLRVGKGALAFDLFLHLGDFAYPNGNSKWSVLLPEYGPLKQRTWDLMMDLIAPIAARVPYMTICGNHEYFPYDFGVESYLLRFHMPASSPALPSPLPHSPGALSYYSFQYNVFHFVALNSEEPLHPGSAQMTWLLQDLENMRKNRDIDWVILMIHRPLYRLELL